MSTSSKNKKKISETNDFLHPLFASSSQTNDEIINGGMASSFSAGVFPNYCDQCNQQDCQEWSRKNIPPGIKFRPTDEDLIFYLYMKVHYGSNNSGGAIRDIDLYKHEPRNLNSLAFDEGEDGRMYFFTPLQKLFQNGKKAKRDTSEGFWKATQKGKEIRDRINNKVIGTKTSLDYHSPNPKAASNGQKAKKTQWLMSEFRLVKDDTNTPPLLTHNDDMMLEPWTLCVIRYKSNEKGNKTQREVYSSEWILPNINAMGSSSSQNLMIASPSNSLMPSSSYSQHNSVVQTPTTSTAPNVSFGDNATNFHQNYQQPDGMHAQSDDWVDQFVDYSFCEAAEPFPSYYDPNSPPPPQNILPTANPSMNDPTGFVAHPSTGSTLTCFNSTVN